jgi:copper amine oxidase-like protein
VTRPLAALLCALVLGLAAPASAADKNVKLTLDGRPVDRAGGIAVAHGGVVYADVVDLVKVFNGLLTFHGNAVEVTINAVTATFTAGSRTATLQQGSATMRGQVFRRNGDFFVPLDFFITRVAGAKVQIDPAQSKADIYVNASPLS